jgi:adenine deaminase
MITTRREFVAQVGLLAAIRTNHPDVVLYNGNVITVDAAQPRAQAIALWRDRILAVGSNADMRALANGSTKLVDLAGRTVVPGSSRMNGRSCSVRTCW